VKVEDAKLKRTVHAYNTATCGTRMMLFAPVLCAFLLLPTHIRAEPALTISIEEPTGVIRPFQHISFGLPLPPGRLKDAKNITLSDPAGKPVAVQTRPLAYHADRSVHWLHVQFMTTLMPREKRSFDIAFKASRVASTLKIRADKKSIRVDTGVLSFECPRTGFTLPRSTLLDVDDQVVLTDDLGGNVIDTNDVIFYSGLDPSPIVSITERGPVRTTIRYSGRHYSAAGQSWLGYDAWVSAHAGSPLVTVTYRVKNTPRQASPDAVLRRWSLGADVHTAIPSRRILGGADDYRRTHLEVDDNARLEQFARDHFKILRRDRQPLTARWAQGWATIADNRRGLTMAAHDFAFHFPAAILISPTSLGVEWHPISSAPITLPYGQAFTRTLSLWFHGLVMSDDAAVIRRETHSIISHAHAMLYPVPVIVPPEWYASGGAFTDFWSPDPKNTPFLEIHLRSTALPNQFGGHRGNPMYVDNEATDLTSLMFELFTRTGDYNYYRYAMRSSRQAMDKDIIHAGTAPELDDRIRARRRRQGEYSRDTSFLTVRGLLLRHLLTGDNEAMRLARIAANAAIRSIEAPDYVTSTRRIDGWPIQLLCDLYRVTHEDKYLAAASSAARMAISAYEGKATIPQFMRVLPQDRDGLHWSTLLLLPKLMDCAELSNDEHLRDEARRLVDHWLNHFRLTEGKTAWLKGPKIPNGESTWLALPALARAHQWTHDTRYRVAVEAIHASADFNLPTRVEELQLYLTSYLPALSLLEKLNALDDIKPR
jgi:hypothetical protein